MTKFKKVRILDSLESLLEEKKELVGETGYAFEYVFSDLEYVVPDNKHFIDTIAFNKKTFKTTIVLKYGSDEYDTVEVSSNKKDFVDFRVGFLLTWLKAHLTGSEFKTLIGQLFFKGKPQITFLRGFALRYFKSLHQMDKFLEAIKDEKNSVNIGGKIIKLVWKGMLNE